MSSNADDKTGIVISRSSKYNDLYAAYHVFDQKTTTEWATFSESANFWISVQYPTAVRIHQIHVRGRIARESPSHWRFERSNDDVNWDVLLSPPNPTYLSSSLNVFDIRYSATAYHRFRLFVIQGSGVNCGLIYLQLFPYSVV